MDQQMMARGRSALAKGIFTALLVGVGAAALSPDWAVALKAQGYYGNVDLAVSLLPSTTTAGAGDTLDFLVTVNNNGPDAANRVRTIAGARNLDLLQTIGCAADPYGYPQCALPSPMAAGGSEDYLLRMKVPPAARGNVQFSVSATSDDDEGAPGDEVALFKAPIFAELDLRTTMSCDAPLFPHPAGRVICTAEIRNAGPAAALQPAVSFNVQSSVGATWSCEAPRAGQCPGAVFAGFYNFTPASIQPGDVLRVSAEMRATDAYALEPVELSGSIWPADEAETDAGNNRAGVTIDTRLFSDDFDTNPGSIQRQ